MIIESDDVTTAAFRLPPFGSRTPAAELVDSLHANQTWKSLLSWDSYARAAQLHLTLATSTPELDLRVLDDDATTAAHLAAASHIRHAAGATMLREALAMVFRIPEIGKCLRDGLITEAQYKVLVTDTDLLDGKSYCPDVDAAIARALRTACATGERDLHNLANRLIFEHDPDAFRDRHQRAKRQRGTRARPLRDGMAQFSITASAEDIALAMAAVHALADSVCPRDTRTVGARRSDAAICTLLGVPFLCQCGRDDCEATTDEQDLSGRHAQIVLHVICDADTLHTPDTPDGPDSPEGPDTPDDPDGPDGPGGPVPPQDPRPPTTPAPAEATAPAPAETPDASESNASSPASSETPEACAPGTSGESEKSAESDERPGFLDGYGLISPDHVREIAARPDTIIRPLNPNPGQTLPTHLPSDPYRFSAALDTFIRARDGYCVIPGCDKPAWSGDLDHVTEYDHACPEQGGKTNKVNGNAKCRLHHLFKTFGNWLDDQYIGEDGHTHVEIVTPSGNHLHSHGHTNEALFPALQKIRFHDPPGTPDPPPTGEGHPRAGPQRRRTRHADKLARRRREREHNRLRREHRAAQHPDDPPSPLL
ncbi:DUF222 domain-containing protein [Tomitella biformata]|uniref:DUF222 domain-containing protein n=2 Tax=Tomitella biformata TaxID=630403 RepID=UPI00190553C2|nr:DUF222 domain-containing protein [Tomitella biformata]